MCCSDADSAQRVVRATLQFCTYNRAHLLPRVLEACFEQTVGDGDYEVVLVNDGSTDETASVIEQAKFEAPVRFIVISQRNSGLARARNAGIARASGERIIFIDDDVLPLPNFVEEHLRSHERHPQAIVRGAVIKTQSFEKLPPPVYSLRDFSANYFWTSNVSVPLHRLREIGAFNEDFAEYGWEDIELGLRLRFAGVRSFFNKKAVAFHYKPAAEAQGVETMLRQARAQARTAAQLAKIHPHWRAYLATGNTIPHRVLHKWLRGVKSSRFFSPLLSGQQAEGILGGRSLWAARRLASEAYYEELERALAGKGK